LQQAESPQVANQESPKGKH